MPPEAKWAKAFTFKNEKMENIKNEKLQDYLFTYLINNSTNYSITYLINYLIGKRVGAKHLRTCNGPGPGPGAPQGPRASLGPRMCDKCLRLTLFSIKYLIE